MVEEKNLKKIENSAEEESKTSEKTIEEKVKEDIKEKVKEEVSKKINKEIKDSKKGTKIELDREYTIPLRNKCRVVPRYKKTNKAIKSIKEFLVKHMKIRDRDLKKIKLDRYLNEVVWARGIKKPPAKVTVRAIKEVGSDIIRVELANPPTRIKFKKLREEKRERDAVEKASKKKVSKEEKPKEPVSSEEDKKSGEEKEKKSAVVEAGEKMGKEASKKSKHQAVAKTKGPKRPVRQALAK